MPEIRPLTKRLKATLRRSLPKRSRHLVGALPEGSAVSEICFELYRSKKHAPLLAFLDHLPNRISGHPDYLHLRSYALLWSRRFDEATKVLKVQYAMEPNSYRSNFNLGLARSETGHPDQAVRLFKKAVRCTERRKWKAKAWMAIANVYAGLRDHPRALRYTRMSWRLDRSNPEALFEIGNELIRVHRRKEALAVLAHVAETYPEVHRYVARFKEVRRAFSW